MSDGGNKYGDANLPCELGSGTEGPNRSYGNVIGGGMIGNTSLVHLFIDKILYHFKLVCY